ncbi:hypothetical protein BOTBODRAFT_36355 [Botryobasidium botryosum FD-172 SS1]|uniref:Uncharacterized protein n=1 Tax=Botryobasidium botryosum (strain FD-172 SS1) TaxID=930990 RepID=A0A067M399_BOTB1|nr:hypothetical protein BOTBODRAFT_36355 [Botryobasidium botryosum FD-172 SS1]
MFLSSILLLPLLLSLSVLGETTAPGKWPPYQHQVQPDSVACRPFGECEPCPEAALHEPFCKPFGNRRLIHCLPYDSLPKSEDDAKKGPILGETPAWESCGRVIAVERADFWEFVMCNVIFAGISLFILFIRGQRLAMQQYRRLAARIGLGRGGAPESDGGWATS